MQRTRLFSHSIPFILAALILLCSHPLSAAEQKTVFLPLKINAADQAGMTQQADQLLEKVLAGTGISMLSRSEAGAMINYNAGWPPPAKALAAIAQGKNVDYVAAGSLTQLGDQISIDLQIFDVLAPGSPFSSYQEAQSPADLENALEDGVKDVVGYAGRNFLIASIAPVGNTRIDSGAILRKINTKSGDFYDPATLREDLKAVFAMGYFDNVEIESTDSDQGKDIIFRVTEKPLISSVVFSGTDAIEEEEIRDVANIKPNTILNPNQLNTAVQQIKDFYKTKGYYNTQVNANLSYPDPDRAEVRFVIEEGSKIYVEKIAFEGNTTYDDDDLEDVIETSTWSWLTWLNQNGVLRMDVLQQDAARLGAFYHNNGFIEAKIGEPQVEQEDDALTITFPISEGPRYRVGIVDIEGDLIEDKQKLIDMLQIRQETYLNRQVLRADTMKLTDLYAEHGYAFAEVRPSVDRAEVGKRVNINLRINKGSLVYFNRVEISGNVRTRDNVIRRDLSVEEGGVFDAKAIRTSTEKLQRLGFFEEVNITPQPTMQEDQMDVTVEVKERSTGQFSIGAGYSSAEQLLFMGEISENNFLGTGNRFALAANISGTTTRFNLSFTNPRIFDSNVSGGIDLFNWEKEYDDYTKDSTGGALRFGHPLFEKWRIYYSYSYTDTKLSDVSEDASEVIKRSQDIETMSAVRVALVRDTRDRIFNPNKGSRNEVSVKYAGLGGEAEFTKVQGSSSWFFPIIWGTTFHVKGAIGEIYANDETKLPVYEHFYLGGMNTVRGFESAKISPIDAASGDRIGGDKMWYSNIEYVFPLVKDAGLAGVLFFDAGNVYAVEEDWDFGTTKKSAGIEFRWFSPMGPLRLSWGYNLDPVEGEDDSVWDFSVGGTF